MEICLKCDHDNHNEIMSKIHLQNVHHNLDQNLNFFTFINDSACCSLRIQNSVSDLERRIKINFQITDNAIMKITQGAVVANIYLLVPKQRNSVVEYTKVVSEIYFSHTAICEIFLNL
jgi:hypothetical protein